MTYEKLKGIFERTGTTPISGPYLNDYTRVCLAGALAIEKYGLEKAKEDFWDEFRSYAAGWEKVEYEDRYGDLEQYNMGKRIRKELLP